MFIITFNTLEEREHFRKFCEDNLDWGFGMVTNLRNAYYVEFNSKEDRAAYDYLLSLGAFKEYKENEH